MICTCGHSEDQHGEKCRECLCPRITTSTEPVVTHINSRWPLLLPPHRAYRPQWPVWEKERLASMFAYITQGTTLFDIGSEEGDLPATFALWGARLVLFEPNPKVWPNIRTIWEANDLSPPLGTYVGFAGDETTSDFDLEKRSSDDPIWPACSYGPVIGDHGFCVINQRPDIPQVKLDDFVARSGIVPDAITMDVEGAELRVLRGAAETLRTYRPIVWVSVHPEFARDLFGDDVADLHRLMHGLGYRSSLLAEDHEQHWYYDPR